jgi:hypothetical protein
MSGRATAALLFLRSIPLCVMACAGGLFAALLISATPAAAQKCDVGTAKKPLLGEIYQIPGGSRFREAYIQFSCTNRNRVKQGLADEKGKLLVPAVYHRVIPLTPKLAAVVSIDERLIDFNALAYRIYEFGKGERKEPLPWQRIFTYDWDGVRTPYAYWDNARPNEIALILEDVSTPVRIRNLGGKGWPKDANMLEQAGGTLIANFTAEDGTPLSRVLTMRGEPISPAIGAIERWETLSPEQTRELNRWRPHGRYNYPVLSIDYISTILTGDHVALPYGKLYQPIGPNGDPLPLPPGAIGVFPLKVDTHSWSGSTTHGWAVVEETPQGLRVRPGLGTLQSVLARVSTLPAYSGMSRYIERSNTLDADVHVDLFAARPAGDPVWRLIDGKTISDAPYGRKLTSTGGNARETIANFIADREAARRNFAAQREQERLVLAAKMTKEFEERHEWLLSSGKICEWSQTSERRGPQTINYMLANCPITSDAFFNLARSSGGTDLALLNKVEYAYWEKRGRYAVPIPPAPRDIYATPNWSAWGDAIVKSARESTDTFIRDRKRDYYKNMEKWNTGKQNWCC